MRKALKMLLVFLPSILILFVLTFSPSAQTYPGGTKQETYRVRKPLTGSIPTSYIWYVAVAPDSNTYNVVATSADSVATIPVPRRVAHWVMAAGRDAQMRIGPRSVCSVLDDPGPPGGCGKPAK